MHQVNEEKASRCDQNLEKHPQTFFPQKNNVLDIKKIVLHGIYFQHLFSNITLFSRNIALERRAIHLLKTQFPPSCTKCS
jgi:hypothetical protein